jgi:hypothetical protein
MQTVTRSCPWHRTRTATDLYLTIDAGRSRVQALTGRHLDLPSAPMGAEGR